MKEIIVSGAVILLALVAVTFACCTQKKNSLAKNGKADEQLADERLAALEAWMREIGVAMNITELGATEEMIPKIADATFLLDGGYKQLTRDEVISILHESL